MDFKPFPIAKTLFNNSDDFHSELPPSSSDKWMICGSWLDQNRGIVQGESSEAAKEGTKAHLALSNHLQGIEDLSSLDDEEMYDLLMSHVEWLSQQPGDIYSEIRVDFGDQFGYVGLTGTSDIIIVEDNFLTVVDLKYGKVYVDVVNNTQLLIYLSGAVAYFGPREEYRLMIYQPRNPGVTGPLREWIIKPEELVKFNQELELAIARNYSPKSFLVVGDHCRKYCNALATCPAVAEHSLKLLRETPI
jgi:hypothetical protein